MAEQAQTFLQFIKCIDNYLELLEKDALHQKISLVLDNTREILEVSQILGLTAELLV